MSAEAAPIRLAQADWFRRVGEVASSVGTDRFHQQLVELFGSTIPHSASWIIRYSRVAPPDVIYTWNVPQDVVEFYSARCAPLDPFSAHWKRFEEPGVRTLAGFDRGDGAAVDPKPYNRLFKAAAKISDELGVFFSTVGNSSLGLFLEREKGRFTAAEIERTKLVFPVLDGFHKTHIGRIFDRLRFAGEVNETQLAGRPTLVLDRHGLEIFANAGWREAAAHDPAILDAVASAGEERQITLPDFLLKIERFDRYFPLAPSGTMFVLAPKPEAGAEGAAERPSSAIESGLTARERDVFDLVMAGKTTGAIAQALGISKGAVKNVRLRIYRKAEVSSERALVQKFGRPAT
ncbi:helix-turn-helix transcriptional regulator [Chelatococcus sambhunathii]|uniref:Helix-turn-helix transcriptional regulator n=1 Tax=Chelatococcus sambhunathii TaxID=363953 RepID=A0ABU1DDM8_9HYPH|nr:helix-turn-helix transcriptional regulator [Chelatococcus sambhunathii]MDR4306222.1 helix-turn-helix transcriptional regulator [Chelatococcus sambhunathii]